MTLRTPRRRISPRTKRRYRAFKDFLRRAIGSASQPDIKINSSIAVNVTNLKHQIVGIERQLNEVSKHLLCTECINSNESSSSIERDKSVGDETIILKTDASTERNSQDSKTKFLYQTLDDRKLSDHSDLLENSESITHDHSRSDDRKESKHADYRKTKNNQNSDTKSKKRKHRQQRVEVDESQLYEKHKSRSTYGNFPSSCHTTSYHSLIEPKQDYTLFPDYDAHHHARRTSRNDRHRTCERVENQKHISHHEPNDVSAKIFVKNEDKRERRRKNKTSRESRELDPDFINNIIKRQYRPLTMFGRRESNLSQFSAPICRDQEFKNRENIVEGSELCSCCYADRKHKIAQYNDVSEMRSICDTRLYSSKMNARYKAYRRQPNYNYNDSSMYDVVPVREQCSPKSHRRCIEDLMCYPKYKEVPPSPRTHRPRLNLKAQNFSNMDMDDDEYYRSRKHSGNRTNRIISNNYIDSYSDKSSLLMAQKIPYNMKTNKRENDQQIIGKSSFREPIQPPQFNNDATKVDQAQATNTTINKSQDMESTIDKTDKALCEIKDILQHFLQEIKKDSIPIDTCSKSEPNQSTEIKQNSIKINTSFEDPSSHSDTNNCSMSPFPIPPSYMNPSYLNPCCYPVFPTYPMNCMQNSFVIPSPSCTCACTSKLEQPVTSNKDNAISTNIKKTTNNTETDKLIKEIYNLVTQSPPLPHKKDEKNISGKKDKMKAVVTRSVGDSIKITRHDAKVGTPKLKYYSKSCEAIGTPLDEEHSARTTASYSDTVIGKLSLEATAADSTSTETGISTDLTTSDNKDQGRFSKVLRSFGLLKKKKKDVIEEKDEVEGESESSTEVEIRTKRKHPEFPQELINYAMHGQEYFHVPPIPPPHLHHEFLAHQASLHHHHYSPYPGYPPPLIQPTAPPCPCITPHVDPQYHHSSHNHHNHKSHHPHHNHHDPQNYYDPQNRQPEVPFCLKEIEVRSTATQSDRRLPFFGKFGKKAQDLPPLMQHNSMPPPKTISTQTKQNKPGFWQKLNQPKPMTESDPRMFSFKKQKELAAGDAKLKNAMLKKFLRKKNPFSPNNLIVKTLIGRDPSSFGEPPKMYKPRMFL